MRIFKKKTYRFRKQVREKTSMFLFDSRDGIIGFFDKLAIIIAIGSIASFLYYYCYPLDITLHEQFGVFMKIIIGYYIFNYTFRFVFANQLKNFRKKNKLLEVTIIVTLIDVVLFVGFDINLLKNTIELFTKTHSESIFIHVVHIFVVFLSFLDLKEKTAQFPRIKINVFKMFIFSLFFLVSVGAWLLTTPEMVQAGKHISPVDAFFTSASAISVTGLTVIDVSSVLSLKGKIILLALMKLGALNIIVFALSQNVFSRFGFRIKNSENIYDFSKNETGISIGKLYKIVFLFGALVEIVSSFVIFALLPTELPFASNTEKYFTSIFLSISSFNSAGFTPISGGLFHPLLRDAILLQMFMGILIVMGATGFPTFLDLFHPKNLRERAKNTWKDWKIATKIDVYSTFWLVFIGIVFFILTPHFDPTIEGNSTLAIGVKSFFQSVNRTAGFNSSDFSSLGMPFIIVMVFLMFIGGASASSAGGIKTSTFAIILLSTFSTIRGKNRTEIFKKNISETLVYKAMTITIFSVIFLMGSFILLLFTDSNLDPLNLLFESVSAFTTCGLSRGITSELSEWGRVIITVSMVVGRVGVLTLVLGFTKTILTNRYKYPDAKIPIG